MAPTIRNSFTKYYIGNCMALIVEVFRSPQIKQTGVDLRFHSKTWQALLDAAKAEGWQPAGTVMPSDSKYLDFKDDYEPDYPYVKMITAPDAENLAAALEKVAEKISRQKLEENSIGPTIIKESEAGISTVTATLNSKELDQFIAYCRQGAFEFWWDD
jgi:hypothetical protein